MYNDKHLIDFFERVFHPEKSIPVAEPVGAGDLQEIVDEVNRLEKKLIDYLGQRKERGKVIPLRRERSE